MYRRVGIRRSGDGYLVSFTPAQFELVRRVLVDLYGGSHSREMVAVVAGETSSELLRLKDREVDFRSRSNIDASLTFSDLRGLYGALAFAFLGRSSEEAFHNRYGFYSENVQAVGWEICAALEGQRAECDETSSPRAAMNLRPTPGLVQAPRGRWSGLSAGPLQGLCWLTRRGHVTEDLEG